MMSLSIAGGFVLGFHWGSLPTPIILKNGRPVETGNFRQCPMTEQEAMGTKSNTNEISPQCHETLSLG